MEQNQKPRNKLSTSIWQGGQAMLKKLDTYKQKNEVGRLSYTTHKN